MPLSALFGQLTTRKCVDNRIGGPPDMGFHNGDGLFRVSIERGFEERAMFEADVSRGNRFDAG